MFKTIKKFIVLLIILSYTTTSVFAVENKELTNELNIMVNEIIEEGKAKGAVLSVIKDGSIILSKGFGYADEYNNIAVDDKYTAFRIGSVSKTFVAVAAQILNQEGKIDMNSDISIYLEDNFPKFNYPVTMHQLLTHTAGFEELITGIAVINVSETEPLSESVRKYTPEQVFKPGEVCSYSNYGIALAAYVIESITQIDFAQFCMERIFLPLNMNNTTYEYMHDIALVSKAYLPNGNETLEPYINLYPEGSAVSTAHDMAKYMIWLLDDKDNRILSDSFKNQLFIKQFAMSEEMEGGGYVWNRKVRNHKIYHDKKGETKNFYTRIALYPEVNTGIFLSLNTYVPESEINAVMNKATDLLYGKFEEKEIDNMNVDTKITGLYVNNWSSFKTPEKILSYIIPNKIIKISKNNEGEFLLNDEKITPIGDNTYTSSIGIIKFIEKNDNIIIATESAITYSKVQLWHSKIIQLSIPILFIVFSLIFLIRGVILKKAIYIIYPLIQLISLFVLFSLFYKGIVKYNILKYAIPMAVEGWTIAILGVLGIIHTIKKKNNDYKRNIIDVAWNFINILFIIWLFAFNII